MIGRVLATAYVATVAGLATSGFVIGSSRPILLAAALALPSSVPGMIGFYMAVGLLAQVPGGSTAWWLLASDVLGVIALTLAALGNLWLAREVWRAIKRPRRAPSG